ncbi:hypothetical protein [Pontibacter ramchanderi]|nr:hypothetical protein [Pontibacter ramchanderi]
MLQKWKTLTVTTGIATILLLGVVTAPNAADLNNGTATTEATTTVAPAPASSNPEAVKSDAKPASSSKQKSVLDAEVLESPLSILKDITSGSDEEESNDADLTVKSSTLVLALKALVATLLSTVM